VSLLLDTFFDPMRDETCWSAEQGHGSFLALDFGTPMVRVGEVRQMTTTDESGSKFKTPIRTASVHGSWYLSITHCAWSISINERLLAHSESRRTTIARALRVVAGNSIAAVKIDATGSPTVFRFDLGGMLEVRRYDPSVDYDGIKEHWCLRQPDGTVLTVRDDGTATVVDEHDASPDDEVVWSLIA